MPSYRIDPMGPNDWTAVWRIFREGIATGLATFETTAPDWDAWNAAHLPSCRLVARADAGGEAVGWAALSQVSGRCVYAGVAEVSIYIQRLARSRGIGSALLNALIAESECAGLWTLQAGIFPENTVSLALHRSCGFRVVGTRERIGQLAGTWRDVVLLERRSRQVGA